MIDTPEVLAFGEILYDVYADGALLGGAPLNFAWYVKQLGISVGIISAVGNDAYGRQALLAIENAGIDSSLVERSNLPTGTVEIRLTEGQPEFHIHTGVAWDNIKVPAVIGRPRLLYFGTLAQRTEVNRTCLSQWLRLKPGERFFDVNLRQSYYDKNMVLNGLRESTIVKVNEDELALLEQMTEKVGISSIARSLDIDTMIVTRGAQGASLYCAGKYCSAESPRVEVVDAVGAGDAFSAVIAVARLRGVPLDQALPIACEAGAYVVTQRGAQTTLPAQLSEALSRREYRKND